MEERHVSCPGCGTNILFQYSNVTDAVLLGVCGVCGEYLSSKGETNESSSFPRDDTKLIQPKRLQ